ncbi:MAG: type IV secretory system conjugative DNA transfer family protein [Pseudomonadota bacterium]
MAFPFLPRLFRHRSTSFGARNDNERNRFGSTEWAQAFHLDDAGLYEQRDESIYVGLFGGRPVYHHGPAGLSIVAGARAGKMRDVLARNLLTGTCLNSLIFLDLKGEGAFLSQNQTADGKYCAYWAPAGLQGILPQDRINPVDYLHIESVTLVADAKVLWENLIASSGVSQADYFESRGREYGEGVTLAVAEIAGTVTLPQLYEAISHLIAGGEPWLDIAYQMSKSRFPQVRRLEAEISEARNDTTGGFRGIIGELAKAVACLSDPILMASVSPPYTMSLADLVSSDNAWQLYLCPPAEYVSAWAPVLKSFFVGAMLYKSRAPSARRITFFLDECGQLAGGTSGGFPLVPRLFTYGAGIGITPVAVFQSERQMATLGAEAKALIQSSAGGKLMFALRDIESAQECSRMLGAQTLTYDDPLAQSRAEHARANALASLMAGGDPIQASLALSQQGFEAEHQTKQHRQLRLPEEVMNTPSDRAYFFHEDVPYPIFLERQPYWEQRDLAGRFHPNPYHPPMDRVQVRTAWGMRSRDVVTEPVPERYAHYPQYRGGLWSRVEH